MAALVQWFQRLRGTMPGAVRQAPVARPAMTATRPVRSSGRGPRAAGRVKRRGTMDEAEVTLNQVCRLLEEDGFRYHLREHDSAIETGFRAKTGMFQMVLFLREEPAMIGALVRMPDLVAESKRPAMAEAIARANYGLSLGCFEMDMSDGEMDYRIAMPTASASVSHEQLRTLLGAAMWTTNRYHRAFSRLLYGDDLSPAEVIAEVEMADGERGKDE